MHNAEWAKRSGFCTTQEQQSGGKLLFFFLLFSILMEDIEMQLWRDGFSLHHTVSHSVTSTSLIAYDCVERLPQDSLVIYCLWNS